MVGIYENMKHPPFYPVRIQLICVQIVISVICLAVLKEMLKLMLSLVVSTVPSCFLGIQPRHLDICMYSRFRL